MAGNARGIDDALALALAAGDSIAAATAKVDMSERTVYRRLADPAFKLRVQSLRGEMIGRALGRMADGMTEAADVLRALLKAEGESVRLGAARTLIDLGAKLRETVEIEERLTALETKLTETGKHRACA